MLRFFFWLLWRRRVYEKAPPVENPSLLFIRGGVFHLNDRGARWLK